MYLFLHCAILRIAARWYVFSSNVLCVFLIFRFCYPLITKLLSRARVSPNNKAVFITGCDTGFGHELAKELYHDGFHVFAGCLMPDGEGAKLLKTTGSPRLQVVELDVTNEESVSNAYCHVQSHLGENGLWAVVNNAGIVEICDIYWGSSKQFEGCASVNSAGPYRVTKKFLPLLIQSKGRVVNVASIAGRIPCPHLTPYVMSKHAVVAFSECLRLELKQYGVKVISIEPGPFRTGISEMAKRSLEKARNALLDVEKDGIITAENYFNEIIQFLWMTNKPSDNLQVVTDSLRNALSLEQPEEVYRPCQSPLFEIMMTIIQALPNGFTSLPIKGSKIWIHHHRNHDVAFDMMMRDT